MAARLVALYEAFEFAARGRHDCQQLRGASEHRHWRFDHCPAKLCREARELLDTAGPEVAAAKQAQASVRWERVP